MNQAELIKYWNNISPKFIYDIYNKNEYSDTDELIDKNYSVWSSYVKGNSDVYNSVKDNLYEASTGKIRNLINEINTFEKVDYDKFYDNALMIIDKYNNQWMKTEIDLVYGKVESIKTWNYYKKYPKKYIVWKTSNDNRVRDEHIILHNLALPVNDPFWQVHFPPDGYNCRCYTIIRTDLDGDFKTKDQINFDELPEIQTTNTAITGKIFDKNHSYMK